VAVIGVKLAAKNKAGMKRLRYAEIPTTLPA
jgi:hypothetical protein